MKITARIRQAESDKGTDALWLFIDREDNKPNVDDLKEALGIPDRPEDAGNVAYPVLESELVVIRDAINEYLGDK